MNIANRNVTIVIQIRIVINVTHLQYVSLVFYKRLKEIHVVKIAPISSYLRVFREKFFIC